MTAANDIEPVDIEPSAEDRRLHSRVRFPKVRVQAPGPEGWQDEFLQDLSVGGVFLVTPRTLPVGGHVSLRLLVPDTETPMETEALVTRIEQGSRDSDSGIALAFEDLADGQREQLASLVERFGHEPTVQVFDDETGEPAPDPMNELLADVDEIGLPLAGDQRRGHRRARCRGRARAVPGGATRRVWKTCCVGSSARSVTCLAARCPPRSKATSDAPRSPKSRRQQVRATRRSACRASSSR